MATKKAAGYKGARKSGASKKSGARKNPGPKAGVMRIGTLVGGSKKGAAVKTGVKGIGSSQGKCTGWSATQSLTPPVLRVKGKCTFPTHGYKVTLKEAVPQGINPRILLLRKIVTPPTGFVIQVPQTIEVSFVKKTKTEYTHVTILPEVTTIKVKQVK